VSVTGCTIRSQTGAIGWSDTTVPEVTGNAYSEEVDELGRAIRAYRRAEGGRLLTPGTPGSDDGDQGDEDDKDAKSDATASPSSAAVQPLAGSGSHPPLPTPDPSPAACAARTSRPRHRGRRQRRRRGLTRTCDPRASPPQPTRNGLPLAPSTEERVMTWRIPVNVATPSVRGGCGGASVGTGSASSSRRWGHG